MIFPFRRITLPSSPSQARKVSVALSPRPGQPISSGWGAGQGDKKLYQFLWKAQKKFGHRKSLPSLLIKLISAGQEAGRRGSTDTRLAKLLGEMALISHPGGREAGNNITRIEPDFFPPRFSSLVLSAALWYCISSITLMRKLRFSFAAERMWVLEKNECAPLLAAGLKLVISPLCIAVFPFRPPAWVGLFSGWWGQSSDTDSMCKKHSRHAHSRSLSVPTPVSLLSLYIVPPVFLQSDKEAPLGSGGRLSCDFTKQALGWPVAPCPSCQGMSLGELEPRVARHPSPNFRKGFPRSWQGWPQFLGVLGLATFVLGFMSQEGLMSALTKAHPSRGLVCRTQVYPTTRADYGLQGCETWESQAGESVWNGVVLRMQRTKAQEEM